MYPSRSACQHSRMTAPHYRQVRRQMEQKWAEDRMTREMLIVEGTRLRE